MNWIVRIISILATINLALACSRIPVGTIAGKSPADDRYVVTIGGNPQNFEPKQKYNITLTAVQGYSFIGFMLAVELENKNGGNNGANPMGYFEIVDFSETKFSDKCNNLVMQTNMLPKSRVDVVWTAPAPGSGCVLIRATVIEHREVWYMDDGFLTKQFCEEQTDDIEHPPPVMDPCCACDEAKYELTFEGKWSRHTHPKDFPANSWRTRFSDIIGASHTIDYRFWRYGEAASNGLREVAEHGSTRTLESELKEQSDQIRTIIKARGISYPNVTGKTFAVFRVDSQHHVISLVSMIDPSPDWIVGVSGLELCLPNCSWVEHKVHNLYPWDAGTDSGPSYMSADQPQVPPDVIRRIKSNFPNDQRSPFYDPTGTPMKPLARLHISRRRLYEKNCENIETENDPMECATHPWGRWSDCSAKCGQGKQFRTRDFKNPGLARRFKCRNTLREDQNCQGNKCGDFDEDSNGGGGLSVGSPENPECALSDWSEWSGCSATCGKGTRTQTRHYLNRRARKKCQSVSRQLLERNEECEGIDCGGDLNSDGERGENQEEANENENEENEDENQNQNQNQNQNWNRNQYERRNFKSLTPPTSEDDEIPPECNVSEWSSWTPCSESCGEGYRSRERQVWNNDIVFEVQSTNYGNDPCLNIKKQEVVSCNSDQCDSSVPEHCYEEPQTSPCRDSDLKTYWYYDYKSDNCALFFTSNCDKNKNRFTSKEKCEMECKREKPAMELSIENLRLERVDCVVSEWVAHECNATCGEGYEVKTREVLRSPKNGGKPCPKKLVRWEKCYKRCPDNLYSRQQQRVQNMYIRPPENECRYSDWSAWSPCTTSCGDNSVRQQTRVLLNNELSYKCRDRVRIERCIVMPCLMSGDCRGPYC